MKKIILLLLIVSSLFSCTHGQVKKNKKGDFVDPIEIKLSGVAAPTANPHSDKKSSEKSTDLVVEDEGIFYDLVLGATRERSINNFITNLGLDSKHLIKTGYNGRKDDMFWLLYNELSDIKSRILKIEEYVTNLKNERE